MWLLLESGSDLSCGSLSINAHVYFSRKFHVISLFFGVVIMNSNRNQTPLHHSALLSTRLLRYGYFVVFKEREVSVCNRETGMWRTYWKRALGAISEGGRERAECLPLQSGLAQRSTITAFCRGSFIRITITTGIFVGYQFSRPARTTVRGAFPSRA